MRNTRMRMYKKEKDKKNKRKKLEIGVITERELKAEKWTRHEKG